MVRYEPKRDDIVVGGQVYSPGRARRISEQIDSKLELRELYQSSERLHGCATTERAIRLLCTADEGSEDVPVKVGFAFEDDAGDPRASEVVPDELVEAWISDYEGHGTVLVWECNVEAFFEGADAPFSGFQVEYADREYQEEYL